MGATFDWDAEVVTADPEYYRWNQWFFLQFLKAGLAYRATSPVDWCPNDGTLAREQVEGVDRHCWRCGAKVEKRDLAQWYLKVTNYADELLDFSGLDWPEPIKTHADELDRPERGRRDRLHDRPGRPPARRRRAARLHDPARHAVRGDVHGPRPGAPARRDADRARAAGGGRRVRRAGPRRRPRSSACRPTARRPACTIGADAINPVNGERDPDLDRRLRPGRLRHRARSWPCPPTTSATSPSPSGSGCRSGGSSPPAGTAGDDGARRRLHRPHAGRAPRQLRAVQRHGRRGGRARRSSTALAEDGRARADRHVPPPRLAHQPPALLGHPDPGHLLRAGRDRAGPRGGPAGPAAGHGRLPRQRREPAGPRRGVPATSRARAAAARRDARPTRWTRSWTRPGTGIATCRRRSAAAPIDRALVERWTPVDQYTGGSEHAVMHLLYAREFTKMMRDIGRDRPGRAVQAAVQPGPDPGHRRRADVQVARQHPGSRRARRPLRGRHDPAVPHVHGAVGPGRPVEPDRHRRRSTVPRPHLDPRARSARA